MDPAQVKSSTDSQNSQKTFCKQPISCPWIANQPYPSTLNKNRSCDSTPTNSLPNIPLPMESKPLNEKTCPTLQHSSSQFFYFLRLMQLFPETHPATLHTVLCLCKNDFFCAVDKLLYAKRCKALYGRSQQGVFRRCSAARSHPYCGYRGVDRTAGQQQKGRGEETEVKGKESTDVQDSSEVEKVVEENSEIHSSGDQRHLETIKTFQTCTSASVINNDNEQKINDMTSSCNLMQTQEVECDKATEV